MVSPSSNGINSHVEVRHDASIVGDNSDANFDEVIDIDIDVDAISPIKNNVGGDSVEVNRADSEQFISPSSAIGSCNDQGSGTG